MADISRAMNLLPYKRLHIANRSRHTAGRDIPGNAQHCHTARRDICARRRDTDRHALKTQDTQTHKHEKADRLKADRLVKIQRFRV